MKKYPVTYKGKEYVASWGNILDVDCLFISEIFISKIFKRKIYKNVYMEREDFIDELTECSRDNPNYYIEQIKTLFKAWEKYGSIKKETVTIEENKQKALAEWDGVIC